MAEVRRKRRTALRSTLTCAHAHTRAHRGGRLEQHCGESERAALLGQKHWGCDVPSGTVGMAILAGHPRPFRPGVRPVALPAGTRSCLSTTPRCLRGATREHRLAGAARDRRRRPPTTVQVAHYLPAHAGGALHLVSKSSHSRAARTWCAGPMTCVGKTTTTKSHIPHMCGTPIMPVRRASGTALCDFNSMTIRQTSATPNATTVNLRQFLAGRRPSSGFQSSRASCICDRT